ncbi:MAG: ETC complex I subunit [Acetobacteraceae bacterium]|nr:ETC complex I subunit [Acetobacteraceae bacterium]
MKARIFLPPKTAMQAGRALTRAWVLEFMPVLAQRADPLTGWIGGGDLARQVRLNFPTRDAAVAYAEANAIPYEVELVTPGPELKPKAYADNFKFNRREAWSH